MDIIKKQKFTQIDTLKFFMCFAVVLFHYRCVFLGGDQADVKQIHFLSELFWYGEYAVEFFFIISGFLIAYNYKEKLPSMGFFSFMKKRIKSFFAPVILSEIIRGSVWPIIKRVTIHTWDIPNFYCWFQSLTFSAKGYVESGGYPIATVTWYVNILLLIYCIFWIVRYICSKNEGLYIPLCLVLVFFGYVCIYYFNYPLLWHENGRGYTSFFVGVLLYEFQVNCVYLNKKRISCACLLILMVLFAMGSKYGFNRVLGNIRMSLIFFVYPTIFIAALNIDFLKKILKWRRFVSISYLSEYIYFSHYLVLNLINVFYDYFGWKFSYYDSKVMIIILFIVVINGMFFKYLTDIFKKFLFVFRDFFVVNK